MRTKVFLRCGQSNSLGDNTYSLNSGLNAMYKTTFPSIKTWTGAAFESLNYATNNNQYVYKNLAGASEFALLKSAQEHYGVTIYDCKYARAGTHLGTTHDSSINWNIATRGSLLDGAISTFNSMMEYLWNNGHREFDVFFIWIQGEGDAQEATGTEAAQYETNLTNLLTYFKKQLGTNVENSNFYPIIVRLNNNSAAYAFKATVKTAELNVANSFPTSFYLDTEPFTLGGDFAHYTNAGNQSIGQAIVNDIIIPNNL